MKVSSGRSPPCVGEQLQLKLAGVHDATGGGEGSAQAGVALVSGVHEQLGLLDHVVGGLLVAGPGPVVVDAGRTTLRELRPGERVVEQLGVEEELAELGHHLVRVAAQVRVLLPGQRARRLQHGAVGPAGGRLVLLLVQQQLGLEDLPLGRGQAHLHERHHLAGALALAHVLDGVFAGVAPVAVVAGVLLVAGQDLQLLHHRPDGLLADAGHERLEVLPVLAVGRVHAR